MPRNPNYTTPAKRVGAGKSNSNRLSIIILTAGEGHRMKTYGCKSLLTRSDSKKTLIEQQLFLLQKCYPCSDITVVVGFDADKVYKILPRDIKAVENERYLETNTLRSASLGLRVSAHDNIMILHGDLVFNEDMIDNITKSQSSVLIAQNGQILPDSVGVTIVDGKITYMYYGIDTKWGQVLYLNGFELEAFKKIAFNRENERMYLFEAVNNIIDNGGTFVPIYNNGFLLEIKSSKDIENIRLFI